MKRASLSAVVITVIFLVGLPWNVKGFKNLEKWGGKYPSGELDGPRVDFFAEPQIKETLLRILPKKFYYRLTSELPVESPIGVIDNYLVIVNCEAHNCPFNAVVMAVGLEEDTIGILFGEAEDDEDDNITLTWFSTGKQPQDLPLGVRKAMFPHSNGVPKKRSPPGMGPIH
jgi:hypothetical protein